MKRTLAIASALALALAACLAGCAPADPCAGGHSWEPATCLAPATCSVCGLTEGEAGDHAVAGWTVASEAGCTQAGLRQGTCAVCGQAVAEEIPPTGHAEGRWEYTDMGDGVYGAQYCAVCGDQINESYEEYTSGPISPGDHVVAKGRVWDIHKAPESISDISGFVLYRPYDPDTTLPGGYGITREECDLLAKGVTVIVRATVEHTDQGGGYVDTEILSIDWSTAE